MSKVYSYIQLLELFRNGRLWLCSVAKAVTSIRNADHFRILNGRKGKSRNTYEPIQIGRNSCDLAKTSSKMLKFVVSVKSTVRRAIWLETTWFYFIQFHFWCIDFVLTVCALACRSDSWRGTIGIGNRPSPQNRSWACNITSKFQNSSFSRSSRLC